MPAFTLYEQHHRAGSPFHQEAHHGQSVVPLCRRCGVYDPGVRSNAHDSQGTNPVVTEGRHRRSSPICEPCLRSSCLISPSLLTCACPDSFATLPPTPLTQLWCEGLHPPPNTAGVYRESSLTQQLGHVLVRQRISRIPANCCHDHLARTLATFERIGFGDRHGFLPYQTPLPTSQ